MSGKMVSVPAAVLVEALRGIGWDDPPDSVYQAEATLRSLIAERN